MRDPTADHSATTRGKGRRCLTAALALVLACVATGAVAARADGPSQTTTSLALTGGTEPSDPGASLTFTATVTGGAPDGSTVSFLDAGIAFDTALLSAGTAAVTTTTLASGTHAITARFEQTSDYASSTSDPALTQDVRHDTTTTLATNPADPADWRAAHPLTLTATVTPTGGGTPSGNVDFLDGGILVDTRPLASGTASLVIDPLAPGEHSFTAHYAGNDGAPGDPSYMPSDSSPAAAGTARYATSVTLTASSDVSDPSVAVTFTASVSPVPTDGGTIAFVIGTEPMQQLSVDLSGGSASFTIASLPAGSTAVSATFGGTPLFVESGPVAISHVVRTQTTVQLRTNVNPSEVHQAVTIKAVVPGVNAGSVTFMSNGKTLGAAIRVDGTGTARLTVSTLVLGNDTLRANYSGTAGRWLSSTRTMTQTVIADTSVRFTGTRISSSTFYPAIDGYRDVLGIQGRTLEPATVTITIRRGSNVISTVRMGTIFGSYEYDWKGRTSSGKLRPEGRYDITQSFVDRAGHRASVVHHATLSKKLLVFTTKTVKFQGKAFSSELITGFAAAEPFLSAYAGGIFMDGGIYGDVAELRYDVHLRSAPFYRTVKVAATGAVAVVDDDPELVGPAYISILGWAANTHDGARATSLNPGTTTVSLAGAGHVSATGVLRGLVNCYGSDGCLFDLATVKVTYTYGVFP